MLNTPTSVDSLPRLRRFTSSQTQLSSFAYLGHNEGPAGSKSQEAKEEAKEAKEAKEGAGTPQPPSGKAAKEKEDEGEEERKQEESKQSEVLCQPVSEIQGTRAGKVKTGNEERREIVEVPLSDLKAAGGPAGGQEMVGEVEGEGDAGGDGDDQKMCCGFFFKVTEEIKIKRLSSYKDDNLSMSFTHLLKTLLKVLNAINEFAEIQ